MEEWRTDEEIADGDREELWFKLEMALILVGFIALLARGSQACF